MSKIQELSRAARRVPVVRRALESGDPRRRAVRLAGSGIVDADLYAAQLGVGPMSVDEAAAHYASGGFREGFTLNVLMDPFTIRRHLIRTDRPVIYDYLHSRAWHALTSRVWNVHEYIEAHPSSTEHPAGPVGHLWERIQQDPSTPIRLAAGGDRDLPWSEAYPVLREATIEWARELRARRARYPRAELTHPRRLGRPWPGDDEHRPTVSIVLPVRNRPGPLRRAVESVLSQTWDRWQLIIVDDGSWDDTPAVADLLAARDDRITALHQPASGVCAARNAGLRSVDGRYVAFLDSDNEWEPSFLEDMMVGMTEAGARAAYATIALESATGTTYRYGSPGYESLLQGNSIDLNTLIVERSLIAEVGDFDEGLRRAVDYDLILRLARASEIAHIPTVGAVYDNRESSSDRISTTEAVGWNALVRLKHGSSPARQLRPGICALAVVQRHDPGLIQKLASLAELHDDNGADVVVVAVGVKPDELRAVRAAAIGRPGFAPLFLPAGESYAFAIDHALTRVEREKLVVVDPVAGFTTTQLLALAENVSDTSWCMPLTLAPDGTVAHMGGAFAANARFPLALLRGHPAEDARALGPDVAVPMLSGRSFGAWTATLRDAGGLDPLLHNDFELEAVSATARRTRPNLRFSVATSVELHTGQSEGEFVSRDTRGALAVIERARGGLPPDDIAAFCAPLGQTVGHLRPPAATDLAQRPLPVVIRHPATTVLNGREIPRLRWAIKTASPAGPRGETWGDTHFARSLASALRQLGQEVIVDALEAQSRDSAYLDDVVLVLRGLHRIEPQPGAVSMMWVISHPDMVSQDEAAAFDGTFAASVAWSEKMTDRWGTPVEPLLQCTDPALFHEPDQPTRDAIVFVGNTRGVPRPTVMEAIRAGIDIQIYGGDWERFIPADRITAPGIDNRQLGRLYGDASIVLNDHWSDMQREGFISNRLFDAVAAGGRVLSDEVAGIAQIFGGAVCTYSSVGQIASLLQSDHDELFAPESERREISRRIREEHSFAARAEVLLRRALDLREAR